MPENLQQTPQALLDLDQSSTDSKADVHLLRAIQHLTGDCNHFRLRLPLLVACFVHCHAFQLDRPSHSSLMERCTFPVQTLLASCPARLNPPHCCIAANHLTRGENSHVESQKPLRVCPRSCRQDQRARAVFKHQHIRMHQNQQEARQEQLCVL